MSRVRTRDLHRLQRRRIARALAGTYAELEYRVADRVFGQRRRVRRTLVRLVKELLS